MIIHYLYLVTCLPTGEKYVGCSMYPKKRWGSHRNRAGKAETRLSLCMGRHGIDNFSFEIIACAKDPEDAMMCERGLIGQYNTFGAHGLNMTLGGEGAEGYIPGESTRAKQSAVRKGKPKSAEWRAAISAAHMGRKKSPDAIARSAAARRGMKQSPEAVAKMVATRKALGIVCSDETRAKIGAAHRGKVVSAESRERMREAQKKRAKTYVVPEEVREKISAAHRGRKQDPEWLAKRVAARRAALEQKKLVLMMLAA